MTSTETPVLRPPIEFFPAATPRKKQVQALDFIWRKFSEGFRDIVIAAPTGTGKTLIGATIAFWAGQRLHSTDIDSGAYYLVTQKMLQDQVEEDMQKFTQSFAHGCSLKSAVEYACHQHGTCMAGLKAKGDKVCRQVVDGKCTYRLQKKQFLASDLSVTNYPYFFSERAFSGALVPRNALVVDECHTLEKQLLGFVEVVVSPAGLTDWAPHLQPVPVMKYIDDFTDWLAGSYLPALAARLEFLTIQADEKPEDRTIQKELSDKENLFRRTTSAVALVASNPDNWVYWQDRTDDGLISSLKPISAVPFVKEHLLDAAPLRIYMSAYPGPKDVFCRSLGLDPNKVCWYNLSSTFPLENRPVHVVPVGSMGRTAFDTTLPSILRMCERILNVHATEKGLIHCASYRIGEAIHDHLKPIFGSRIIYPKNAAERDKLFDHHKSSPYPTVMLSPSMTEGFNLQDDLARFQIIAKVPYPYLGDRQVAAKEEKDPAWYSLQAAMSIIQACGRIVRSDTDHGITYILDSDFKALFRKFPDFFPSWFTNAIHWL